MIFSRKCNRIVHYIAVEIPCKKKMTTQYLYFSNAKRGHHLSSKQIYICVLNLTNTKHKKNVRCDINHIRIRHRYTCIVLFQIEMHSRPIIILYKDQDFSKLRILMTSESVIIVWNNSFLTMEKVVSMKNARFSIPKRKSKFVSRK